jgi:hypothetical protein
MDRERLCGFPGEHGDGSGAENTSAIPTASIDPHLGEGPGERINGRRALATADEVIE